METVMGLAIIATIVVSSGALVLGLYMASRDLEDF